MPCFCIRREGPFLIVEGIIATRILQLLFRVLVVDGISQFHNASSQEHFQNF
jgi:hypothetical protein